MSNWYCECGRPNNGGLLCCIACQAIRPPNAPTEPPPLISPKSVYNDFEAVDLNFVDEVEKRFLPAVRSVLDFAKQRGIRLREAVWIMCDLVQIEGSDAILQRAMERRKAMKDSDPKK